MTIGRRLLAEPTPPTKLIQQPDRTFRKRRSLLIAALAAAFGLIVGAGITTVAIRDRVEVTSRVSLEALPGHTGHGTAELITDQGQPELRVQIDAPTTPDRSTEAVRTGFRTRRDSQWQRPHCRSGTTGR
jgi:hypothetical protein